MSLKEKVDAFIDNIPEHLSKGNTLHIGGAEFRSIEDYILDGMYRGLVVVNESKIPSGTYYAKPNSQFHK